VRLFIQAVKVWAAAVYLYLIVHERKISFIRPAERTLNHREATVEKDMLRENTIAFRAFLFLLT
jgi:hypothetical protein